MSGTRKHPVPEPRDRSLAGLFKDTTVNQSPVLDFPTTPIPDFPYAYLNTGTVMNKGKDTVIYADSSVVVTQSTFRVRKALYKLNGILRLSMWTIQPDRWPGAFLLLLGSALAAFAFWIGVPPLRFSASSNNLDLQYWVFLSGGVAALAGFLMMIGAQKRYAVRITTDAEGEKNALVSRKREYIAQVVDAIHTALDTTGVPPVSFPRQR